MRNSLVLVSWMFSSFKIASFFPALLYIVEDKSKVSAFSSALYLLHVVVFSISSLSFSLSIALCSAICCSIAAIRSVSALTLNSTFLFLDSSLLVNLEF